MSRKKHAEHVNHERWLVSYADFITMLFALFVVLYATANAKKTPAAGSVGAAVQQAFREMGLDGLLNPKAVSPKVTPKSDATKPDPASVDEMAKRVRAALQKQIESGALSVRTDSGSLVISLREAGFFDSGTATPRADAAATLSAIAAELRSGEHPVRVEGHTDDVPIHTAQFASNWELSAARAADIARRMIDGGIAPERISASGYAEFHPVADNATLEGRAQNRRVDIVVLRDSAPVAKPQELAAAETAKPPAAKEPGSVASVTPNAMPKREGLVAIVLSRFHRGKK